MNFAAKNMRDAKKKGEDFFEEVKNDVLAERKIIEQNYYNHIFSGLVHVMNEESFKLRNTDEFSIESSRRLIFTNQDCVSYVQILVRDEINIIVQMRSSDYENCLPTDLEFFSNIPYMFYRVIEQRDETSEEWKMNFSQKRCKFTVNFGSLHVY